MKLRTLNNFEDAIDKETGWRKKELAAIMLDVKGARGSLVDYRIRAGIALLYGHWEGWIRGASRLYVSYVSQKNLRNDQLTAAWLGLSLRSHVQALSQSKSGLVHREFADFLMSDGLRANSSFSLKVVDTESNLSSVVLDKILQHIDMPDSAFDLVKHLIDERLVKVRNTVAHGEYQVVNRAQYIELHSAVIAALDEFTAALRSAASTEKFRL